jgi:hypothetical protein
MPISLVTAVAANCDTVRCPPDTVVVTKGVAGICPSKCHRLYRLYRYHFCAEALPQMNPLHKYV